MGEYDSPKRSLPYPLRNALVFSQTTEDDVDCIPASSFVWPEDSDERVLIPFYLSLNEYNVLSSTIDVGSDVAYGADALRVVWLWQRNMRCEVSLCDAIRVCIETSDIVREAIMDLIGPFAEDIRQDPTDCKKIQMQEGQDHTWLPKIDLTSCIPTNESIRNFLLADSSFTQTIYDNLPPNTQSGNSYPPLPITGDDACKAATEIVNRIRDLIVDVYADLATIDPDDIAAALLNQSGWNAVELFNLITEQQASLANEIEILAAFDADKDDMICELKSHSLDQAYIQSWIDTAFATYTAVRPIVAAAVNAAATDGRWSLWATIGMATGTGDCPEDCDTPELELVVSSGFSPSLLEFITTTADGDVYEITVGTSDHYLKMATISAGSVPFYIVATEEIGGAVFGNTLQTQFGQYTPQNLPCWLPTTYFNIYLSSSGGEQAEAGDKIRITIAHQPCHEVFLRPRVDGDWGSSTFSIVFVGFDGSGNVIYDVTNTTGSGSTRVGFDTVTEDLLTLKSAYLVSATPAPGYTIGSHYHEQADQIGSGTGANGTISSKKWDFIGIADRNVTVRVVVSANPY